MHPAILVVFFALSSQMIHSPGLITPQDGILYDLDILYDNILLAISPDMEQTLISILNERVAEIQMSNGDLRAVSDYRSKLSMLEKLSDVKTNYILLKTLDDHEKALESVRAERKEVEVMLEQTIQEIKSYRLNLEGKSKTEIQQMFTSYISLPEEVSIGQDVTVSFRICNPLSKPVSPEIHVVAVKEGIPGNLIQHEETRALGKVLEPGSCYSDSISVTVPSEYFGIPLKGRWSIDVEVKAGNTILLRQSFSVNVS